MVNNFHHVQLKWDCTTIYTQLFSSITPWHILSCRPSCLLNTFSPNTIYHYIIKYFPYHQGLPFLYVDSFIHRSIRTDHSDYSLFYLQAQFYSFGSLPQKSRPYSRYQWNIFLPKTPCIYRILLLRIFFSSFLGQFRECYLILLLFSEILRFQNRWWRKSSEFIFCWIQKLSKEDLYLDSICKDSWFIIKKMGVTMMMFMSNYRE